MKTLQISSLLIVALIVGSTTSVTAGQPSSPRDCVRQMCYQLRYCAEGEIPEQVEKKTNTTKDVVGKKKTEDAQGFLESCRQYAWWDYLFCTGEFGGDKVDQGSQNKSKTSTTVAPAPSAK